MVGYSEISKKAIRYHYGGYFIFSPCRTYVNGCMREREYDIDFISYFDILDDLRGCGFDVLKGDRFYYLKGDCALTDNNGLIEIIDDGDVKNMLDSYQKDDWKPIDIFTLSPNFFY